MAASYPSAVKTFPTRSNGQTITPAMFNDADDEVTGIEQGLLQGMEHIAYAQAFRMTDAATETIASGVITVAQGYVAVDTEASAASDDLDTITPGTPANGAAIDEGTILVLKCVSNARIVTAKDGTGNLHLAGNFIFTDTDARLTLVFDGTNWVEVARAQSGAWVTPTFSAGNFTASSGNWTVDSGDVAWFAYLLRGNTMTVAFGIDSTDVSATPTTLNIAIPLSKVATKTIATLGYTRDAGATPVPAVVSVAASGTAIRISRLDGANFTATSSDNTGVFGEIVFEVNN